MRQKFRRIFMATLSNFDATLTVFSWLWRRKSMTRQTALTSVGVQADQGPLHPFRCRFPRLFHDSPTFPESLPTAFNPIGSQKRQADYPHP
jgi:hypothetical protein